MTIAFPGTSEVMPAAELSIEYEESITLVPRLAWLDVRHDTGNWYASLRLIEKEPAIGSNYEPTVNGFCDCWRGPYHSRDAALSNGYSFGRAEAIQAHTPSAGKLSRRVWDYLERRAA